MSETTLTSLLEYLYNALTPSNQRWVAERLIEHANMEEGEDLKPYTVEELRAMIEASEADIAAGRTYSHEEVMREWDEEVARMEREEFQYAEAI